MSAETATSVGAPTPDAPAATNMEGQTAATVAEPSAPTTRPGTATASTQTVDLEPAPKPALAATPDSSEPASKAEPATTTEESAPAVPAAATSDAPALPPSAERSPPPADAAAATPVHIAAPTKEHSAPPTDSSTAAASDRSSEVDEKPRDEATVATDGAVSASDPAPAVAAASEKGGPPPVDDKPKRSKAKVSLLMLAICTAVFLAALDMTIITTALYGSRASTYQSNADLPSQTDHRERVPDLAGRLYVDRFLLPVGRGSRRPLVGQGQRYLRAKTDDPGCQCCLLRGLVDMCIVDQRQDARGRTSVARYWRRRSDYFGKYLH